MQITIKTHKEVTPDVVNIKNLIEAVEEGVEAKLDYNGGYSTYRVTKTYTEPKWLFWTHTKKYEIATVAIYTDKINIFAFGHPRLNMQIGGLLEQATKLPVEVEMTGDLSREMDYFGVRYL